MARIIKKNDLKKKLFKTKDLTLAHGVFDLLHIGHIRHLKYAKSFGKKLFVSLTGDKYVNKGPGKPYFNENQRLEFLSSLEFVDYVYINQDYTPIELIKLIKPKYYFKGSDYKDFKSDITGNISKEEYEVKKYNGKMIFTDDIQFSSSQIINDFFLVSKPFEKLKKESINLKTIKDDLLSSFEKISKLNICILGEVIFDHYKFCSELSKPSKENIVAVKFEKETKYCGGVLQIAKNLSSFVNSVEVISNGNFNNEQKKTISKNFEANKNINFKFFNKLKTITKTRYLSGTNKKLFECYNFGAGTESDKSKQFSNYLIKNLKKYDAVILADFGHGLIDNELVNIIEKESKFLAVNCQTNAENRGFNLITKYKKCDFVCLDRPELDLATHDRKSTIKDKIINLSQKIKFKDIIITLGGEGVSMYAKKKYFTLPAFETKPLDTMGAGDAVLGISSLLARVNTKIESICFISNLIGAEIVNFLGHENYIKKNKILKSLLYTFK